MRRHRQIVLGAGAHLCVLMQHTSGPGCNIHLFSIKLHMFMSYSRVNISVQPVIDHLSGVHDSQQGVYGGFEPWGTDLILRGAEAFSANGNTVVVERPVAIFSEPDNPSRTSSWRTSLIRQGIFLGFARTMPEWLKTLSSLQLPAK